MDENIRESNQKDATGDLVFFLMETFKVELAKKEMDKIREIIVTVPLEGKIDFSKADTIISQFHKLESIKFSKGKITSVINIPQKLIKMDIQDNYLMEFSIKDVQENLRELFVSNNYLKSFDFSTTPNLETLEVENNAIEKLENIHSKLRVLNVKKNKLQHLELKNASSLETLRVSNNPLLFLQNIPSSVIDYENENNPTNTVETNEEDIEVDKINIEQQITYLEAVERFFELKSRYEDKLLYDKRTFYRDALKRGRRFAMNAVRNIRGNCIKCGNKEGTFFKITETHYTAICGATQSPKCELNIKLYRGVQSNLKESIHFFKELLDENKNNIITFKLDNLFSYTSEDESVERFNEEIKDFNDNNLTYSAYINDYNTLFNNSTKKELLKTKILKTQELKKTIRELLNNDNDEVDLNIVSEIYTRELKPEMENIMRLRNDIIEVEEKTDNTKDEKLFRKRKTYLRKEEVNPVKLETQLEKPRVQHFIV
jgi:hypothetical protein